MGFTFFTACLYLAWFTWPLKSMSSEDVLKSTEITEKSVEPAKTTAFTSQCNKHVPVIGSNENNLYLYKVLNKRVLNDFVMVKKKAFYVTPPFEKHGRVTHAHLEHAEVANDLKKNRLEQFTMKKKEAFYITPPFDYETVTPKPDTDLPESSDSSSEKEKDGEIEEKHENLSAIDKDIKPGDSKENQEKPEPVADAEDLNNSVSKMANVVSNDTDRVAAKSYDYDITFKPDQQADADQKVIHDLTRQQGEIMRRFNNLAADKDKVENYNQHFNNLMKEIQRQRASSTVMIMVDETEVKNKLRADPFVQRVLKMAKRRKDEYFRRAQEEALKKV